MAGWLPIAGGMGQGLDEVLARIMQQNAQDQHQQQITETNRHNVADEGLNSRKLGIDEDYKTANVAGMNEDRQSKATQREQSVKDAQQKSQDEVDRRQQEDEFIHTPSDNPNVQKQQDLIKLRRITGDKGSIPYQIVTEPNGPPDHSAPGPVEKDEHGNFFRVNRQNQYEPITKAAPGDAGGPTPGRLPVKAYQPPVAPILYAPNGEVPRTVDRGTNTAAVIKAKETGEPLAPKLTSQEANRASMAGHVSSGIERAQDELDEAERQGLLGPLAGRTYGEFLAQKLGTTGNPESDDLLGRLQLDLKNISTGFAAIHSQRGSMGNALGIEHQLNSTKMSHALINGGLESIKQWVNDYAGDRAKPQQPQDNPNAPPPMQSGVERVRVIGPKGETGTIPKGGKLPEGWKLAQ